ncbi:hypothetical protein KKH42_05455, partial [bacterium]|nr:hypothetical protein [bacterium]
MSVPKRIEKIISKGGDIVDYDSDRIIKSIALTITDVEHATQWITDRRAQMCYETINKAAYDAFYNLHFLLKDFFKKYISFEPEERYRRLENSRVMERLLIVLLEEFKSVGEVQNNIALAEFIEKEIDGARLEEKYRLELFPSVTESEKSGIIDFLSERVLKLSRQTLVPEQLYPARDFVMDMIEQTLKKIGEIEIAEGFMIFREGKKKIRDGEITTEQFTRNGIHYEMCRKTLEWNIENKCEKIFDLNDWVRNRDGKDIGTL